MAVETITTVLAAAQAGNTGTDRTPAGAYDLTDLPTVKDELNLKDTSADDFLQRAITQASTTIANYCNRVFPVELLQDVLYIQQDPYPYQVPGGVFPLQLSRWPMFGATVVSLTGNTHSSTLVDGLSTTVGLSVGAPFFGPGIPAGAAIAAIGSGSLTLTLPATATASGVSFNTGASVVQTLTAGVTQALVYGTDYTIDPARGWLVRLDPFTGVGTRWEAEPVTVQYAAGYLVIPADLVDATLRLVTTRFSNRGRDPMLKSIEQPGALGTQTWWVGGPRMSGSLPEEIAGLISQYRVPVTA